VGVAGGQAVAMRDLDHFAVARLAPDEGDAAFRRGEDRRADRTAEVETLVHRAVARERVAAIAEARRDVLEIGGLELRNAVETLFERRHLREAEAEALETRIDFAVGAGREQFERTTHRVLLGGA